MPKLAKIEESWDGQKVVNAIKDVAGIELYDAGSGHGQGWRITSTGDTGSIPLTSHGDKNLKVAIKTLIEALQRANFR